MSRAALRKDAHTYQGGWVPPPPQTDQRCDDAALPEEHPAPKHGTPPFPRVSSRFAMVPNISGRAGMWSSPPCAEGPPAAGIERAVCASPNDIEKKSDRRACHSCALLAHEEELRDRPQGNTPLHQGARGSGEYRARLVRSCCRSDAVEV